MPSRVPLLSSLFSSVGRAFGLGSDSGSPLHPGNASGSTPRFEISSVAVAEREGRGPKCRFVIQNTGGDCFDVGVLVEEKRVGEFASFRQGQSKRATLVFPTQKSFLNVKIRGFDTNGSVCERAFRKVVDADGSISFS